MPAAGAILSMSGSKPLYRPLRPSPAIVFWKTSIMPLYRAGAPPMHCACIKAYNRIDTWQGNHNKSGTHHRFYFTCTAPWQHVKSQQNDTCRFGVFAIILQRHFRAHTRHIHHCAECDAIPWDRGGYLQAGPYEAKRICYQLCCG